MFRTDPPAPPKGPVTPEGPAPIVLPNPVS